MNWLDWWNHRCKYTKHKKLKMLGYHNFESDYGIFYVITTKTGSFILPCEPTHKYILRVSCACGNMYYTNPILG